MRCWLMPTTPPDLKLQEGKNDADSDAQLLSRYLLNNWNSIWKFEIQLKVPFKLKFKLKKIYWNPCA